jgi:hypothetical protein
MRDETTIECRMQVYPKNLKKNLDHISLAREISRLYGFADFRGAVEFASEKSDLTKRFGCCLQFESLFRI